MFIEFDKMPLTSRIWIYQSVQPVAEEVSAYVKSFTESWEAHGQPLKSSFNVFYNHFLVIAVDESFNHASGCSIDKSVHFVQELEKAFHLNLFDRLQQAIWHDNTIVFKTQKQLKEDISLGLIERNTLVFNNLVQTLGDLQTNWQIPAEQSWLARLFKAQAIV
jgi:hypothetical protein